MKKVHIALAVKNIDAAIVEYTKRLGAPPVAVAEEQYALWRTNEVNLSVSVQPAAAGQLRHLGFEDPDAPAMTAEYDGDGFMWERFTAAQQRAEMFKYYPDADYPESNL